MKPGHYPGKHRDTSTGRNKRDKSPLREDRKASPQRSAGHIASRAASARKMTVERALRRRSRRT